MKATTLNSQIVHLELSADELIEKALQRQEGILSDSGALCIQTGKFTGRSPKDKFLVRDSTSMLGTDWKSEFNIALDQEHYLILKEDVQRFLDEQPEIFQRTYFACADPAYHLKINVITQNASSNLFAYNMFLKPEELLEHDFFAEWTILQAPSFFADPQRHGTRDNNLSVISFADQTILIGETGYTGEIKEGIFTVLNFLLPIQFSILSMHCSANIGSKGDTALFFGLSGTGKTTLSTDSGRSLIGDDEHGWSENAMFNFEGGCYAKTIGLEQNHEPEIFAAIRHGALVENVKIDKASQAIDFTDSSITENTRVSFPISYINKIVEPSMGNVPENIFFLSCDASEVLPPISKLSAEQAEYYFLSGYTSKVAGTESGINIPKPTSSSCFGAPFLPLSPNVYAKMLGEKLKNNDIKVWLVNTGWCGPPSSEGRRISLSMTRKLIRTVLAGEFDQVNFEQMPIFNLFVPCVCNGIPTAALNPYKSFADDEQYLNRAKALAGDFRNNFARFSGIVRLEVLECNPIF